MALGYNREIWASIIKGTNTWYQQLGHVTGIINISKRMPQCIMLTATTKFLSKHWGMSQLIV